MGVDLQRLPCREVTRKNVCASLYGILVHRRRDILREALQILELGSKNVMILKIAFDF